MKKIIPSLIAGLAFSLSGGANAALESRLGGQAVYDTDLNITWMQDANYAQTSGYDIDGLMTWQSAMDWADQLIYMGYSDWRLPTTQQSDATCSGQGIVSAGYNCIGSEIGHLYYIELGNKGTIDTAGLYQAGYGLVDDPVNPNDEGLFSNLQSHYYWSGSEYAPTIGYAFTFDFSNGVQSYDYKSANFYALAVRDGDVAAIPEPETYAMMLAGLSMVGAAARRRRS